MVIPLYRIFSLNFVRSTQICILPSGFGTTTIAVHHSVGLSTLDITRISLFSLVHFKLLEEEEGPLF